MKLRQSLWLVPLTCSSPPWPFKPLPLCWAVCVVLALVFVCYRIICLVLTYFFGLKSLPCGATNHHLNSSFFSELLDSILCHFICLAILFQKHSPRSALSLAWIYPKILWEMLGDVEKKSKEHFLMYCHVRGISSGFFGVGFFGGVFLMEHLRLLFAFNKKFFSFFSFFFFWSFHLDSYFLVYILDDSILWLTPFVCHKLLKMNPSLSASSCH